MKIICPYVFEQEIAAHKENFWELDVEYEQDIAGIGSDLMYQNVNKFPNDDIFILHADMGVFEDDWFEKLKKYIKEYPKQA